MQIVHQNKAYRVTSLKYLAKCTSRSRYQLPPNGGQSTHDRRAKRSATADEDCTPVCKKKVKKESERPNDPFWGAFKQEEIRREERKSVRRAEIKEKKIELDLAVKGKEREKRGP